MISVPTIFMDQPDLLTANGFNISKIWYHGTCSSLLPSIKESGVRCSGDKSLNDALRSTMNTLSQSFEEKRQPVFLTPSKTLAYYWARQAIERKHKGQENAGDKPAVLTIELTDTLLDKVQPDVGAAALILMGERHYLDFLQEYYALAGLEVPACQQPFSDRMDYLKRMGMAYLDEDVARESVKYQLVESAT